MQQQIGGRAGASGSLQIKRNRPHGPGLLWRLRNLPHFWRGLWRKEVARLCGIPSMVGEVRLKLIKATGEVIDYGVVSYRVVTTAYVTAMATYQFDGSGTAPTVAAADQLQRTQA